MPAGGGAGGEAALLGQIISDIAGAVGADVVGVDVEIDADVADMEDGSDSEEGDDDDDDMEDEMEEGDEDDDSDHALGDSGDLEGGEEVRVGAKRRRAEGKVC
jgi:hypothetical protein